LTSQSTQFGFQDVGTIAAIHGTGSAKINGTGFIKVQQSVALPGYADKSTVFLNGWRANYPGGDHHITNLGTAIGNIKNSVDAAGKNHSLSWVAVGSLTDDGYDKGMEWSYFFTVIAWNSARLNLIVDHGGADAGSFCTPPPQNQLNDNYFYGPNNSPSAAISGFYSFIQNPGFLAGQSTAVLPRGFDFNWDDHHIRQVSYNIDHSEVFADHRKYNKRDATATPETLPPLPISPIPRVTSLPPLSLGIPTSFSKTTTPGATFFTPSSTPHSAALMSASYSLRSYPFLPTMEVPSSPGVAALHPTAFAVRT
jgi:hypothetical protein